MLGYISEYSLELRIASRLYKKEDQPYFAVFFYLRGLNKICTDFYGCCCFSFPQHTQIHLDLAISPAFSVSSFIFLQWNQFHTMAIIITLSFFQVQNHINCLFSTYCFLYLCSFPSFPL